jgi:hypothetical protein
MSHLTIIQVTWVLTWIAVLASCGFAIFKGGPPERFCGFVILAGSLLYQIQLYIPKSMYGTVALLIDGVTGVVLLFATMRYASLWLGGIMVAQALVFMLHSFYVLAERRMDSTYSWINNSLLLFQLACLTGGVIVHGIRRRRSAAISLQDS